MLRYYKEKELSAIKGKIKSTHKQSNYLLKNKWKVIGFGIIFSILVPNYSGGNSISGYKSVLVLSGLSYKQFGILTACLYFSTCILAHFIWKRQDEKRLKKLETRKKQLEEELVLKITE